jgi:hypothetical protein
MERLKYEANEWFVPIREEYPDLEKEYLKIEPENYPDLSLKDASLESIYCRIE